MRPEPPWDVEAYQSILELVFDPAQSVGRASKLLNEFRYFFPDAEKNFVQWTANVERWLMNMDATH
jgi:hypothetical protein